MGISIDQHEALAVSLREAFDAALDANAEARQKIWDMRDAANALAAAITIEEPIAPIPDARVYVASRSRYAVSHVVNVHDGKLRCTCEDATYRPENGPCWHATTAINEGTVDPRAVWDGGLHGKPEYAFNLDALLS